MIILSLLGIGAYSFYTHNTPDYLYTKADSLFKHGETEAAIKIYTKLADDKNYTKAKTRLGILYTDNDTVKPNYKLGIKYLTEASVTDSVAMRCLMVNVCKFDIYSKLERLANKNIENNRLLDVSYYCLGSLAFDKGDYPLAFYYWDKSASYNYEEGYIGLGYIFYYGAGCQKNDVKAREYFNKALSIDSDNVRALYPLGRIYEKGGYGVSKNVFVAYKYFLKAANLGNNAAKREVAKIKMNEFDF